MSPHSNTPIPRQLITLDQLVTYRDGYSNKALTLDMIAAIDSAISHNDEPPSKRRRLSADSAETLNEAKDSERAGSRHPLGVRPAGNAYLANKNIKDATGLFASWPDELVATLFEGLSSQEILALGSSCKALHAFSRNEELWRSLFISSPPSSFQWRGTWRSTFLNTNSSSEPILDCSHLFSDVLHRPFYCAHIPLEPFVANIPKRNQITRMSDCESDAIFDTDQPAILTDVVTKWAAYKDWSIEYLLEHYRDTKFRAEAVDWPLRTYNDYMLNNNDESPLYLFDSRFAEKMSLHIPDHSQAPEDKHSSATAAYTPLSCFGKSQDLFSVLGPQRPDYRWLIIGPTRSGSTFHKDPNNTSAWNAVIRGRKYWIMFPSSTHLPPPPGVFISPDGAEVTSPLSIAEWLLGFHAEARRTPGCREGICEQGEVLYVPAGWYHLVLNLEDSIALTQNFVPRHKLPNVLEFLREKKDQVSGFADDIENPYELFVEKLREKEPGVLSEALDVLKTRAKNGRARWEEIKSADCAEGAEASFSFGFGTGDDDDDDIP